jgi:hypothetical protein
MDEEEVLPSSLALHERYNELYQGRCQLSEDDRS